MRRNVLCELLDIDYPILQGSLARIGLADLAAAVSNAGGLGIVSPVDMPDGETLRREIRRTRSLTSRPFGVNLVLSTRWPVDSFLEAIVDEGVRVVITSAGDPQRAVPKLKEAGAKVLHVAGSVRQALKAVTAGVDGVIAEGYEGGGQKSEEGISTMVLVPVMVDALPVPVVAAGGIVDARGFVAALALGAAGVQMGTRFVASAECPAHANYKAALMKAGDGDVVVIRRGHGRGVSRVLGTSYTRQLRDRLQAGASPEEIDAYMSGEKNRLAALQGEVEEGPLYAGQSASLIHSIETVKEIIDGTMRGAIEVEAALRYLAD